MSKKLHKIIKNLIDIEGEKYNIDDISEDILDKAASMSFTIGQALRDEIKERKLNKYCGENIEGKYVILKKPLGNPVYMLVRTAFITKYFSTTEQCICFQGVGFFYTLNSPYSDNNYSSFSTWQDVYIRLEDIEKEGTIKEISKEGFNTAFYNMITDLKETFEEWKDEDCKNDSDSETKSLN